MSQSPQVKRLYPLRVVMRVHDIGCPGLLLSLECGHIVRRMPCRSKYKRIRCHRCPAKPRQQLLELDSRWEGTRERLTNILGDIS